MEEIKINMPLLGDSFPNLSVQTTHGPMNLPEDLKGKWFVLFSHPADFTPVCTTEFVAFQKRYEEFEKLRCFRTSRRYAGGARPMRWMQWIKEELDVTIQFPIVAANDTVALKLGMLHPGKGTNTVRAVFIEDPKGKVRLIMYYPQEVGRNMDEVVRAVKALQISDKQGAVPAGWPDNELIGSNIIVPPATDEKTAEQRVKDYENFDWWFCHKPLEK